MIDVIHQIMAFIFILICRIFKFNPPEVCQSTFISLAKDLAKYLRNLAVFSVQVRSLRQNRLGSCRIFAEMGISNSGRM
jgi:hypothetical protein